MKKASVFTALVAAIATHSRLGGADASTAQNSFTVNLSPPAAPAALLADSPFGINTAFNPDSPDLEARIKVGFVATIKAHKLRRQ